jgi:putative ABC transport system permease protein
MSRWLTQIRLAVRSLFRRPQVDQELDEEFQYHLERQIEDNLHRGLAPEEARYAAMREMGPIGKSKQECRDARRVNWMQDLAQDLRYGLRMLRKSAGFTAVAVLTLALGIGVTTAILSIIDPVLFRPLPYANSDRLVSVGFKHAVEPFEFMSGNFYYDWSDHQTVFTEMTAQSAVPRPCDLTDRNPVRLTCSYVHHNFLPTLGIRPVVGSNFAIDDMLPDAPLTVMLSYELWKSRYNQQPAIVDQVVEIDGVKAQVKAVLPKDFEMPSAQPTDLLLPKQVDVSAVRAGSVSENMRVFARLKSGITATQADASLQPLFEQSLRSAPPQMRSDIHLVVRSLRDRQLHDVLPVAWIMLGAVVIVLLVCCANAGSLFLARTAAREQEFAIRAAWGAGKRRILRQTLTEGLLVSLVSAVVGCILAEALLRTFMALAPEGLSFLRKATLDLRILLATLVVAFACGIACGLLPVLGLRSVGIAARSAQPSNRPKVRRILVVAQIASSAVLLSGALLLLRSLNNIDRQDLGVNSNHVLTVSAALSPRRYNRAEKRIDFFRRAIAALRGIPGVTSVAMADSLPPNGTRYWYSSMAIAGKPPLSSEDVVSARAVTTDYFNALGIRIVRGRGFSDADVKSTEHLMVINQKLAALMFPDQDPLGQQIRPEKDGPSYRVIGVAADVRNDGLTRQTLPEYDTLLGAIPDEWTDRNTYAGTLVIRSALTTKTAAPWIRQRVEEIDPSIPIELHGMQADISTLANRPRFETALLGFLLPRGCSWLPSAYMASLRTPPRDALTKSEYEQHWGLPESTYCA